VRGQRPLGRQRRLDGVHGPAEGREERVALAVHLAAAASPDGRPQQPPVFRQYVGVALAQLVKELRRALDVGEEEGVTVPLGSPTMAAPVLRQSAAVYRRPSPVSTAPIRE
jgi:hypothetical protein